MPEDLDKNPPIINIEDLERKAKEDPKSKNYNNPNSRKNLRQYRKTPVVQEPTSADEDPIVPEIIDEDQMEDEDTSSQAEEIVRGRKLSPELVQKLIPRRGIFTPAERKRFTGIVVQYLTDFKNEEPTAADVDDIFEIAKSDIMEMRLLDASRNNPEALINVNQSLERIYKRKQTAKENLSARRSDRKDSRASQDISIVDLVVDYDAKKRRQDEERIKTLLETEDKTDKRLREVIDKDGY